MPSLLKSTTVEITNGGNSRSFHNNNTTAGLLKTDGNWDMYMNNSGQMWTANYGWLHDYFFSAASNCTSTPGNCSGNTGNCFTGPAALAATVAANCGNQTVLRDVLEDGGSTLNLRTYAYNFNCACNCVCTCK